MALKSLVIAFGAVLVAAAPAAAGTNAKAEKVNAAESTGASKAAQTVAEKKYCTQERDTGSRLETKECRTKAEWAQEGIDIEQFAKKK